VKIDARGNEDFDAWIREQARKEPRTLRTLRHERLEDLRCHPDLCERLRVLADDLPDTRHRYLCGFPVLVHSAGIVYGVAAGTTWMALRLPFTAHSAVVHTRWGTRGLGVDWIDVDPWLGMVESREGTRRLRGWCRAADVYAAELATPRAR
jgi:hypothetical protein